MTSRFEPERSRVFGEMCREFGRKIPRAEIAIAVDEACEEWYGANAAERIENSESRYGYVRRAARDQLLNILRRKQHEISITHLRAELERNGNTEWDPDAHDGADAARDWKGDLRWLLKKIPKGWRRVEELYRIEGYSEDDIAEMLGRTKKAISRIVEKAEKRMEELGIKYLGYPPPNKNRANRNNNNSKKG